MSRLLRNAAIVLSLAVVDRPALGDDVRLQGVFVNRSPSDQAIKEAIDRAVAPFNFVARPVARSRLRKSNPLITRAEFVRQGSDIVLKLGMQKPVAATPGGSIVKWTRDDGEVLDVGFQWDGATLVQSFKAADGMRYNRYDLSADGRSLTIQVTLTSPMLDKPVQYELAMIRERTE